jgi:hypothetical protein
MRTINKIGGVLSCMGLSVILFALFSPDTPAPASPAPIATAVVAAEPSTAAKAAADKKDAIKAEKARKKAESDADAEANRKELERRKQVVQTLPDKTPGGVPVEKGVFYMKYVMHFTENPTEYIALTDAAVDVARQEGLRCDSVTSIEHWVFNARGLTLKCNEFRYTYYIEDKGRGYQARIAD